MIPIVKGEKRGYKNSDKPSRDTIRMILRGPKAFCMGAYFDKCPYNYRLTGNAGSICESDFAFPVAGVSIESDSKKRPETR